MLNKFSEYIKLFEYAREYSEDSNRAYYKIDDIQMGGEEETTIDGEVLLLQHGVPWVLKTMELLITSDDEHVINTYIQVLDSNTTQIKSDIIKQLFSIEYELDRMKFINVLMSYLTPIHEEYIRVRSEISSIYLDINAHYLISCRHVIFYDIYIKYFNKYCYKALVSLVEFFELLLNQIEVKNKYSDKKYLIHRQLKDMENKLVSFNRELNKEVSVVTLKDYFKDSSKFSKIMNLPNTQRILFPNGSKRMKTRKAEIAEFLNTLNQAGLLLKRYNYTELLEIAVILFGANSLSTVEKNRSVTASFENEIDQIAKDQGIAIE